MDQRRLPWLFALSGFSGDLRDDHNLKYEAGELSRTAYLVYDTLLQNGPLDTVGINRSISLFSKPSRAEYARALTTLQEQFMVLPVGISTSGRWHYSFIYDLVLRRFPGLPENAAVISDFQARCNLIACYMDSAGSASLSEICRLFKWPVPVVKSCMERMLSGFRVIEIKTGQTGKPVTEYIIPDLV